MLKKILVPTDGSSRSERAAQAAIEMAGQLKASILTIAVVEPYPFPPMAESPYMGGSEAYEQRALELAKEHVAGVAAAAKAAGVACETLVVHALEPYDEIINAAATHGCDAIFMATHGRRGVSKLFAGSVTQKVIAHAKMPVMVFQ